MSDYLITAEITETEITETVSAPSIVGQLYLLAGGGSGGGAVASVNGYTGTVVLTKSDVGLGSVDNTADVNKPVSTAQAAADAAVASAASSALTSGLAGKVPTTRLVASGTGLSGGGDLSADRTLAVTYGTTAGTACQGNDSRLSDARTPSLHAASHASGGSDPITIAESQVTGLVADLAAKAPLASPTFTGTPAAPTAAVDTNTTQLATTAFVLAQAAAATPLVDGTAAVGTSTRYARADHVHPTDTTRAAAATPTLTGTLTLDGFVIDTGTYSTQTFARLKAANAATNVNVLISPKGNGYITAFMPDGTLAGGNQRGQYAIDLVPFRSGSSSATEVASGNYSVLVGGQYGKATGDNSVCIGGYGNTVSGLAAFGCATTGTISGNYACGIGFQPQATNTGAVALGYQPSATDIVAVALGGSVTASARSSMATGENSVASMVGQRSHASRSFAANGDCQSSELVARNVTTNATATELFLEGSSARAVVPANATWCGFVRVTARTATATGTWGTWIYAVSATRGVAVGTVTVSSATLVASFGSNAGAPPAGWAVAFDADTTNGALRTKATGAAATTIRWGVSLAQMEVAFP